MLSARAKTVVARVGVRHMGHAEPSAKLVVRALRAVVPLAWARRLARSARPIL